MGGGAEGRGSQDRRVQREGERGSSRASHRAVDKKSSEKDLHFSNANGAKADLPNLHKSLSETWSAGAKDRTAIPVTSAADHLVPLETHCPSLQKRAEMPQKRESLGFCASRLIELYSPSFAKEENLPDAGNSQEEPPRVRILLLCNPPKGTCCDSRHVEDRNVLNLLNFLTPDDQLTLLAPDDL
ncbi:hypothetical protein EYF80_019648 [Liparis tanakae]|uniref:Uncharacterized protein n=1 Tax=Liparis tanakae TaxID=230148 RepID=A0A4Z2HWS1_9TELE|nr:hypothetical protein EYF80_019648 [Liparis tanakae]